MATVVRSMALGPNMYLPNGSTLVQQTTPVNPYRKRPIAPAPPANTGLGHHQPSLSLKDRPMISKKYCTLPYSVTPQQSVSIQRRNARERNRVKQVNNGFANLRQHIPGPVVTALTNGGRGPHKKLSKVDTLKVAVKYIRSLQRMLDEDMENSGESTKSTIDSQALSPVSYYGSMSESSTASSPAPSQLSEYSSYSSSQPETLTSFKREPYDVYSGISSSSPAPVPTPTTVITTTTLPSMTSFSTGTYSQPMHHVYKTHPVDEYHQPEELSPQNTDDEELLDAISWWQQQQ